MATISALVPTGEFGTDDLPSLDPEALVSQTAGPMLIVSEDGLLVAANGLGEHFHQTAAQDLSFLRQLHEVFSTHRPREVEWTMPDNEVRRFILRLRLICAPELPAVVVDVIETTLQQQLIGALTTSRRMFKTLAEVTGDFSFAIDSEGRIAFVSGQPMLGYEPWELNGRSIDSFGATASQLFRSDVPVRSTDVWMTDKGGEPVCVSIALVPLFENGRWEGARGSGVYVTEERVRALQLAELQRREALYARILEAIRSDQPGPQLLAGALEAVRSNLEADYCALHLRTHLHEAGERPNRAYCVRATCNYRTLIDGELVIARASQPWSSEDTALLQRIAEHIAIAAGQTRQMEDLQRLSMTDSLTGLANRRAFSREVRRRLAALGRHSGSAALLVIDLDHFKTLNDSLGHAAGDMALRELAKLLNSSIRASDLPARFGGDEFCIWLENIDTEGARKVAADIVNGMSQLRQKLETESLSASIGVAMWTSPADTFDGLYQQADRALYSVKHSGRDGVAVAGEERA